MAVVGGLPVAIHGRDPDEWRVAHGRCGEVPERVVVGPLPLHAAEAEALGGQAPGQPVGARAPGPATLEQQAWLKAGRLWSDVE